MATFVNEIGLSAHWSYPTVEGETWVWLKFRKVTKFLQKDNNIERWYGFLKHFNENAELW